LHWQSHEKALSAYGAVQLLVQVHAPLEQTILLSRQTLPQLPQLFRSESVLTQMPLQSLVPSGHLQTLFTHVMPPEHWMSQPPQLLLSLLGLRQMPLQSMLGDLQMQTPLMHERSDAHLLLQAPQLRSSSWRFWQVPPQSV